jgi:tRNA 2-thiouridine synthesizing protein A
MATVFMDAKGLKCPVPSLKMTQMLLKHEVLPGDVLEVLSDCPTFEIDVKSWCHCAHKALIFVRSEADGTMRCQVQI